MGRTIPVINKKARKSFRYGIKYCPTSCHKQKANKEMHGITIQKNGKQALELNKLVGNNKWIDSIKKEIAIMI